ncbi:LytR/AlgR family response regulator transcription factor [Aquimarina algiphila]|uniref:LytR/AlgR family response regulator transcription factor n=1 Tax=Aquimarina algiphila TaxID=2047982 RepID=UPI00232E739D|nr:LytTR family DNA-binding domain-containing protein [Aquimarina algiphila]
MQILIIEDELRIAKRLKRMIQTFFRSLLCEVHHVDTLDEGLQFIVDHKIDLLCLDLNLNGENGFEMLKQAVAGSFQTIIISAYRERAIEAFEYGVLDFVPKPFTQERIDQAFHRIINEKSAHLSTRYLAIKRKGGIYLIKTEDVLYIKGADVYAELVLKNGITALHNKTLESLVQILSSDFERIHKSYIVNMTEVKGISIEPGSKYSLELNSGEFLPIGRTKYKEIKSKWFE